MPVRSYKQIIPWGITGLPSRVCQVGFTKLVLSTRVLNRVCQVGLSSRVSQTSLPSFSCQFFPRREGSAAGAFSTDSATSSVAPAMALFKISK